MLSSGALRPIDLLGVAVHVRCNDPELLERLEVCYARSPSPETDAAPLEASLERKSDAWRLRVAGRDELVERDSIAALRSFNHELLQGVMLRAPELYYVHAAVLEVDGRGIVLPGLSLAGKSTLALALVLSGARFLSDELLAFDPRSGKARAFPRALKIRDVCVPYFPEQEAHFVGSGEGRFLPFEALPADVVCPEVELRSIVVPRWSGRAPTALIPISAGQALLDLASSSLNFGTHRAQSIDCLAQIVSAVSAWRLDWHDPWEAVAELRTALAP